MKLLCEFKKDSARLDCITIGHSVFDLTGELKDYQLFPSETQNWKSAFIHFQSYLRDTFGYSCTDVRILRRMARGDSGLACLVLHKIGGSSD